MRRGSWLIFSVFALVSTGCSCMNRTEQGATVGGLFGAAAGTVIGGAMGAPLAGAAIGGATGAGVGALAGNAEDRRDQRRAVAAADWRARNQMRIEDVVQLAQQHVSDEIIIRQIETSYSRFQLTAQDITFLKQQGVSDRVVGAMQVRRAPPPYGYAPPPPGAVVIVEPSHPPVAVGVGFGISGGGGHHWR
ncbi:MAG: hypothetical protein K2X38_06930 [Gemmataceae bacterium]|nr:hypothetical protein [Gemmataceae bacterium]